MTVLIEIAPLPMADYLVVVSPEVVRVQGHRLGLEHLVRWYRKGMSPEELVQAYPGLALKRRAPEFDALRVGDEGVPPLSADDPTILRFLEQRQRPPLPIIVRLCRSMSARISPRADSIGASSSFARTRHSAP